MIYLKYVGLTIGLVLAVFINGLSEDTQFVLGLFALLIILLAYFVWLVANVFDDGGKDR